MARPKKQDDSPLRGDAAWAAAKQVVADHNEAAHARGREQRAAVTAKVMESRRIAERKEAECMPVQPGRD
jgi:hypothetical protein